MLILKYLQTNTQQIITQAYRYFSQDIYTATYLVNPHCNLDLKQMLNRITQKLSPQNTKLIKLHQFTTCTQYILVFQEIPLHRIQAVCVLGLRLPRKKNPDDSILMYRRSLNQLGTMLVSYAQPCNHRWTQLFVIVMCN